MKKARLSRRQLSYINLAGLFLFLLMVLIAGFAPIPQRWRGTLLFLAVILALVVITLVYQLSPCPHCGAHIHLKISSCPRCGKKLDEPEDP